MFYHLFCINQKETIKNSLKKQHIYFSQSLRFLTYFKFELLLTLWLNNVPFSLEGPLNCIYTHVTIKVNVLIQNNIYHIHNYVIVESCLFRDKYSFFS